MAYSPLPALGQSTKTGSLPVTVASDQGNISVTFTQPALVASSALIGKVGIDQTTVGTTNAVALAQIGANTILTGNGATGTGSQRVTIASDNTAFAVNATLQTGANVIGALTANQSVNNAQINGVTPLMGNGVTGTGSQRVTIASDNTAFNVNTVPPTLTKGTQGSTGLSVQELKDAGRSCLAMTAEFTLAQTTETLLAMTLSADGAATTTFSSRAITSGKKFRIQSISGTLESLGSGTAPQRAYLRLRRNTAGATTASSPLQAVWAFVNNTAIVKSGAMMDYEVPDAMEMNGDGTATFGFTLETPDWVASTATGRIKLTVIGYEY